MVDHQIRRLTQEVGELNDADRLRSLLDGCEKRLAALTIDTTPQLLRDTQTAHELLAQLQAAGADVRGEAARLDTIGERIVTNASAVIKNLGGRDPYNRLRAELAPDATECWWTLDKVLEQSHTRLIKRLLILIGILVAILAAGYIARPVLFPPDPVGDAESAATRALQSNNLPVALQAINTGLAALPTNTELLVWKGILQQKSGDMVASTQTFSAAMKTVGSDKKFYLVRALANVRMGDSASVITDTTTLLNRYPDYAEAYYVRATGYEGVGDRNAAIADLEKCSALAQKSGDDTLFAQSRVRLATLLQAGK